MQLLVTHGSLARTRVLQLRRWQLVAAALGLAVMLMALSGLVYHYVFLKAAREGWPVISTLVRPLMRDEIAERDRVMRENLDAMAQKVGELQAKLIKLEAMSDRVSGRVGVKLDRLRLPPAAASAASASAAAEVGGGRGGPYLPVRVPNLAQLQTLVGSLDEAADFDTDVFTLVESRQLEGRLKALMVSSRPPVEGEVGSGFGFRRDPFTGRMALHTGLYFPAEAGTVIRAAAGGIVTAVDWHPEYGYELLIDHGNGLMTRDAHCSAVEVKVGALVRGGQPVARVGTTARSNGPHLQFEVLVDRFLPGPACLPRWWARPAAEPFRPRPARTRVINWHALRMAHRPGLARHPRVVCPGLDAAAAPSTGDVRAPPATPGQRPPPATLRHGRHPNQESLDAACSPRSSPRFSAVATSVC